MSKYQDVRCFLKNLEGAVLFALNSTTLQLTGLFFKQIESFNSNYISYQSSSALLLSSSSIESRFDLATVCCSYTGVSGYP